MRGQTTGVILAGGRGHRLDGRDKGLIRLNGRPLIEHAIAVLQPQTDALIISANRHIGIYRRYGVPVVQDKSDDYCGPLAGILAAMQVANTPYILTLPCDCPFAPQDLAHRLWAGLQGGHYKLCLATDRHGAQPLISLIATALKDDLARAIAQGQRKVHTWMTSHPHCLQYFEQEDTFLNINTFEALAKAENLYP